MTECPTCESPYHGAPCPREVNFPARPRPTNRAHRWAANEDPDVVPFQGRDRCLDCGVARYSEPGTTRADRSNVRAAAECPGPPTTETIVIPLGPGVPDDGWKGEPDTPLQASPAPSTHGLGIYTAEEFAERARQAFAPPVRSRDVDAEPRFRNDSPRWTDWGYP